MISGFSVKRRNYGHWDIYDKEGRIFKIRGGPGKYLVIDGRPTKHPWVKDIIPEFNTLPAAMGFICDELMYELIIAEGQQPNIIEERNV